MELELAVDDGAGARTRVALPDGAEVVVGRVKTCDVVVAGHGVSRQHCVVRRRGDVVVVVNQSTTKGGTTLDDARVEAEARVPLGATIGVGDATLTLVRAGAAPPSRAPRAPRPAEPEAPEAGAEEEEEDEEQEEDEEAAAPAPAPAPARGASGSARSRDPRPAPAAPPTPPSDAPPAAAGEAPADAPPPPSAKEQARAFARRKRLERTIKNGVLVAVIFALSGAGTWLALRVTRAQRAGGGPPGTTPPAPGEGPPGATEVGGPNPDRAWGALLRLPADQLSTGLEAFAGRFPDDPRAAAAAYFAEALRAGGGDAAPAAGPAGGPRPRADAGAAGAALADAARRLVDAGDLARAAALLELLPSAAPGSPAARAAATTLAAVRTSAAEAVDALRLEARTAAQRLGPVRALTLVLDRRARLRGLGQDEALDDLVAGLEEEAARLVALRVGARPERSGRASTVEKEGLDAALRFDFETAWARLDELLTLSLDDEARLRAHWLRHHVRALDDGYKALLALAAGPAEGRPSCTLRGGLRARLRSSDGKQAVLEPIVDKGSGELTWPWSRFTPSQVQELLAALPADDFRLALARALHAFRTGLDDAGVAILLDWAGKKRTQGEAFSFYALATDTPLPEGGFVVFEGRLVAPKERDRVLAERQAAREAAAQLAAEAREVKETKRLQALVQKVFAVLDAGNYEAGRAALARIVEKHADVPGVGDVARARLESPILRRRDVRLAKGTGRNGPSSNRLDVYLLGDGFVLDDQKQVAFDRYADSAVKFYQLQDVYAEYDAYFNYWACNTVSKDEGLTKDTGDPKDTCLRGRVEGGVYTIPDRGNAFALLEKAFPGEHDRQVNGIGNDFANVATGGGGVVACAKTMLAAMPHELGHALGGLGDEYDFEPNAKAAPPAPAAGHVPAAVLGPNLVAGNRRDELLAVLPWKDWLDATGAGNWTLKPVDLFEGGNRQPRDVWRPQRACVMRDVGSPFCAVCAEVMVLRIYEHVRPIDQVWPDQAEVTLEDEPLLLRVLVMKPKTHDLFVHWRRKALGAAPAPETEAAPPEGEGGPGTRVRPRREGGASGGADGEAQAEVVDISGKLTTDGVSYIHFIKLGPRDLPPGRHEVSAEVWDPTPWVLEKHREALRQTRRWVVTVPPR